MAVLSNTSKPNLKKILLLGDSGSGKTGSLVSLALAGYSIKIIDFDAQAEEVIRGVLSRASSPPGLSFDGGPVRIITPEEHEQALSRFDIEPVYDTTSIVGSKVQVTAAKAWASAMRKLNEWMRAGLSSKDIVVIDSLTFASKAAASCYLAIQNRLSEGVQWSDYNEIQKMISTLLEYLYTPSFTANVIVMTHIDLIETMVDTGMKDGKGRPLKEVVDTRALPMSIGKALGPIIPQYFNISLVCRSEGKERARKRYIYTTPIGLVDTKTPRNLPPKLPLESGLRTVFAE